MSMQLTRLAYRQIEAARLLGVSDRTLRRWTKEKLIDGKSVAGGVVLYPHREIERMLRTKGATR